MRITDAQVHIWSGNKPLPKRHRQVDSFTAEELITEMDEAGVDSVLIHPPCSWDPDAVSRALDAVKRYPRRFAIMGQFPIEKGENRHLLEGWKDQPGMLGLRWPAGSSELRAWVTNGSGDWLWSEAGRLGIPIALGAGHFLPEFRRIVEQNPHTKLIVDHLGVSGGQDAAAFSHLSQLLTLAHFPNVAVKATSAPAYSSHAYPYRNIHEYLHRMYDAFGPERWFWGTDLTKMPCSYRQCVTMFTEELPWLKGRDLELVMGEGLRKWIGWKDPD